MKFVLLAALLPHARGYGVADFVQGKSPSDGDMARFKGALPYNVQKGLDDVLTDENVAQLQNIKGDVGGGASTMKQAWKPTVYGKAFDAWSFLADGHRNPKKGPTDFGAIAGREKAMAAIDAKDAATQAAFESAIAPQGDDIPTFDSPGRAAGSRSRRWAESSVKVRVNAAQAAEREYQARRDSALAAEGSFRRGKKGNKRGGRGMWGANGGPALEHEQVFEHASVVKKSRTRG